MYTVEKHSGMHVTPNGNAYDVGCPKCHKVSRVTSSNPPRDPSNNISVDKITFLCSTPTGKFKTVKEKVTVTKKVKEKDAAGVETEVDKEVEEEVTNTVPILCGYSVSEGQLVGN